MVLARAVDSRKLTQGTIRKHDHTVLRRDELLHCLAHPPMRVAPELILARWVPARQCSQQAEHASLDQLITTDGLHAPVFARDESDPRQAQIGELGTTALATI